MKAAKISPKKIKIAQIILGVISVSALLAGLGAIATVTRATEPMLVVETWRMVGFFTFAALFAILAQTPLANRPLWLVVILNKFALTLVGLTLIGHPGVIGASDLVFFDGALTLLLVAASTIAGVWKR